MDPVTIRPATAGDVLALSELARRTWSDAFGDSLSSAEVAEVLERTRSESYFARALQEHTILVAEGSGGLVGYVQFGDVDIPEVDLALGDRGLHRLYVDRAAQERGLGRRLMEAALRHPRLEDAQRVYLAVWERNERAVRLYESAGFRAIGTPAFAIGEREIGEDVVMMLDRSP